MDGAHCSQCKEYETRVMQRDADQQAPEDLRPCESYRMSPEFQSWLLIQMGPELKRQVMASGLDRMAMVKAPGPEKSGPGKTDTKTAAANPAGAKAAGAAGAGSGKATKLGDAKRRKTRQR